MKRAKALIFLALLLLGSMAHAQSVYTGIYWISGTIEADAGIETNNRMVVFYLTSPEAGYAYDFSGPEGLSGRPKEFMLNAMDDWRMSIAPGHYKIAVVKQGNYGVDETPIDISGNGYDSISLTLAYGAGIASPEARALPPGLAAGVPAYERIWFDDRVYQKTLVEEKGYTTIISQKPKITAWVTAESLAIDPDSVSPIILDEGTAGARNLNLISADITQTSPTLIEFTYDFEAKGETPLSDGDHTFKFTASNSLGTITETANVSVMALAATQIVGIPINYPSPVRLSLNTSVTLQYGLTKDTNIDIYIYDLTGTIVKKFSFNAGEPGGSAGGEANPNKVTWNLIADQGGLIGAGIYVWNIVDRDSGKLLGAGKLAAAP